ncbi:hypothetical protein CEXT_104471 [Caerostris extrusa]|uniref:Uncharacterized protein n=1 Tax=Caerostris extrusa TaxID=172846 RepID=A0AAV4QJG3_CAEEX|nr:hypothetical protein CEXT_104471 [Caerostris extrusa]
MRAPCQIPDWKTHHLPDEDEHEFISPSKRHAARRQRNTNVSKRPKLKITMKIEINKQVFIKCASNVFPLPRNVSTTCLKEN